MVPYDHIKERPHLHPITIPAMQKMSYLCVSYYGNDSKYMIVIYTLNGIPIELDKILMS